MVQDQLLGLTREEFTNPSHNKFKKGKFIVTGVVQGAEPCIPFIQSLRRMARHYSAELVFLPMRAHVRPNEAQPGYFHEYFHPAIERGEMVSEFVFNRHLKASDFHLNPQMILSLTGLDRFTDTSVLIAHPKLFMRHIAVGHNKTPRVIHTTGVCTLGDYQTNRMGALASLDHTIGAILVELDGDSFHLRQLECMDGATVIDLGTCFHPEGRRSKAKCVSLTLGDVHAGQHDDKALAFGRELAELLSPEYINVHDLVNGLPISHHLQGRILERLHLPESVTTLDQEMTVTRQVLQQIKSWSNATINIVKSNHDQFLHRYLSSGRWINDSVNVKTAALMFAAAVAGRDPLKEAVDPEGIATWFTRETDFTLNDIQQAAHFDMGPNGAKATPASLEKTHGKATGGHTHSAFIWRGIWGAGHSSHPRHGYNEGASNWTQSNVVQYDTGARQIITLIKGRWRA